MADVKIADYTYFSFFTKYSLLDSYGFLNGLLFRINHKFFPDILDKESFEYQIRNNKDLGSFPKGFNHDNENSKKLKNDIQLGIISLVSRVVSIGLDKKIKSKLEYVGADVSVISELSHACHSLDTFSIVEKESLIQSVKDLFIRFRENKHKIGTSIQLTYKTRLVLKLLERLRNLLRLQANLSDETQWKNLILEYKNEYRNNRSVFQYLVDHFDLLLFQIVEHSSLKGEQYIVENKDDYIKFFKKSMLAGALIAVFSIVKLYVDQQGAVPVQNALLFSLNYAACFVLVKQLGGVIATKQPAMTAATIAKYIDRDDNLKLDNERVVVQVVKNVSRSQGISFIGNVLLAFPVALLFISICNQFGWLVLSDIKVDVLKSEINFLNGINLYYAGIAGVFLAASGLLSGYIENKFKFARVSERLINHRFFLKLFSKKKLSTLVSYIEQNIASMVGNISLGVFLGSAFLVHELVSIPFDIRHIAFSSSFLGVIVESGNISILEFVQCFVGVCFIGVVNFIVSFLLIFFITIKSRGVTFRQVKGIVMNSFFLISLSILSNHMFMHIKLNFE